LPYAYETLLWDVMSDDPTLFMRADQVEAAWQILMPVLKGWSSSRPPGFPNYAAGTWGPAAATSCLPSGACVEADHLRIIVKDVGGTRTQPQQRGECNYG